MKSIIFWDMTPCSPFSFNQRFGETYRLHLQSRRNTFSKTSKQAGDKQKPNACFLVLLNLFLRPWRWRPYVPPKRQWKLNGLHGVISQKMILFITTAVKTSNSTLFKIWWHGGNTEFGNEILSLVSTGSRNYWVFGLCPSSGILKTREHNIFIVYFSCYLPLTKPGLRYLYSCSYTDTGCPVIEVSSF
jgi:hypothetical protein